MNKSIVYLMCLMVLFCVCITGCGPLVSYNESSHTPHTRYVDSYDGVRVALP